MKTLLVALLALAPTARAADDAPEGDLGKIQGKWKAMVGPEKNIPITLEIKGQKITASFTTPEGEDRTLKGELKLDEKASPRQIDWVKFEKPDGGEFESNPGIYKLDGDELTVCNGGPGGDRPSEFKDGDGGPPNLIVFKRVKAESK